MTQRNFVIEEGNTKPSISGMMLAIVLALKDIGGSGTVREITEQIIKNEKMGEKEQSYISPGGHRSKLNYYLPWARTYLKMSGDLESLKYGVWALTKQGFKIENHKHAEKAFERYKKKTKPSDLNSENWKEILSGILQEMDGYAFERLCQRLLREAGFIDVNTNSKKGGDDGIDGTGILRLNLISFKVYFQCKRWQKKHSVPPKEIRDFRGALDSSVDKGLFITTSSFSKKAKEESQMKGKLLIDLIDGELLCDLLKENNLGIQTKSNGQITITPEWFDRFKVEPQKTKKPKPPTKGTQK